jgi:hypothetical protein
MGRSFIRKLRKNLSNAIAIRRSAFRYHKKTFCEEGIIFQIGVAPGRIGIITKIDGVDFIKAYPDKQEIEIEDVKIPFISKEDLIRNKESTGREKDKLDAKYLRGNYDT